MVQTVVVDGKPVGLFSCLGPELAQGRRSEDPVGEVCALRRVAPPSDALAVNTVKVEAESVGNTILDSGSEAQVIVDTMVNAFRATPAIGSFG